MEKRQGGQLSCGRSYFHREIFILGYFCFCNTNVISWSQSGQGFHVFVTQGIVDIGAGEPALIYWLEKFFEL